jgi:hypothetical protein
VMLPPLTYLIDLILLMRSLSQYVKELAPISYKENGNL